MYIPPLPQNMRQLGGVKGRQHQVALPLTPKGKVASYFGVGEGRRRGEERNLICKKHIRHQNSYLMIRILWAVLARLHNYIDRYFLFNQKKLINETTKIL